jgi:hypothetical protein
MRGLEVLTLLRKEVAMTGVILLLELLKPPYTQSHMKTNEIRAEKRIPLSKHVMRSLIKLGNNLYRESRSTDPAWSLGEVGDAVLGTFLPIVETLAH